MMWCAAAVDDEEDIGGDNEHMSHNVVDKWSRCWWLLHQDIAERYYQTRSRE